MAKRNLTDRLIRGLKTSKEREDFWDLGFRGASFGVRVFGNGVKQFTLIYRNRARKQKRFLVGDTSSLSLADARIKARTIIAQVDRGEDPGAERAAYKRAETFTDICKLYLDLHARVNKKASSVREDERIIKHDLLPAWEGMKICDIKRRDIIAVLDQIKVGRGSPVQANRTRALIGKIFRFALEREIISVTPCAGLPRINREHRKERSLTHVELNKLCELLKSEKLQTAGILKLILLTAQRPGEVKGIRWIDIKENKWSISAERTKNGRPHTVHLSPQALEVLSGLKEFNIRLKEKSRKPQAEKTHYDEFVFPSRTGGNVKWLQKLCDRICSKLETEHFTPHDLRRTAATNLARLGTSRDVLGKILNHASMDSSVTAIYDRYDRGEEQAKALDAWGQRFEAIEAGVVRDNVRTLDLHQSRNAA